MVWRMVGRLAWRLVWRLVGQAVAFVCKMQRREGVRSQLVAQTSHLR